jgi:hypothetical protein
MNRCRLGLSRCKPNCERFGVVAYAALHQTLRYRGEDTKLYSLAFTDGSLFFAKRAIELYDAANARVALREIGPGTVVRVVAQERKGVNWMSAVQVIRELVVNSPFGPLPED